MLVLTTLPPTPPAVIQTAPRREVSRIGTPAVLTVDDRQIWRKEEVFEYYHTRFTK